MRYLAFTGRAGQALLSVALLLLTICSIHAANPAFEDFFGTNGLIIRTNGRKVQVDGSILNTNKPNLADFFGLNGITVTTNNGQVIIDGSQLINLTNSPVFGQLSSPLLAQSFGSGSRTNGLSFGSETTTNVTTTGTAIPPFPYTGLVIQQEGYYQVFGSMYYSATGAVTLFLSTNSINDYALSAYSDLGSEGVAAQNTLAFTGIKYFAVGDVVGLFVITTPAAAIGVNEARLGIFKVDVNSSGGGGGGGGGGLSSVNVKTNGVTLGSVTDFNFTTGVTGSLSGVTAVIGTEVNRAALIIVSNALVNLSSNMPPWAITNGQAGFWTNKGPWRLEGVWRITGAGTNDGTLRQNGTVDFMQAVHFRHDVFFDGANPISAAGGAYVSFLSATNISGFYTNLYGLGTNHLNWVVLPHIPAGSILYLDGNSNVVGAASGDILTNNAALRQVGPYRMVGDGTNNGTTRFLGTADFANLTTFRDEITVIGASLFHRVDGTLLLGDLVITNRFTGIGGMDSIGGINVGGVSVFTNTLFGFSDAFVQGALTVNGVSTLGTVNAGGIVTAPFVNVLGTVFATAGVFSNLYNVAVFHNFGVQSNAPASIYTGGRIEGSNQVHTAQITVNTNLYFTNMIPWVEYEVWITNSGAFTVTWPGIVSSNWSQFRTNPVIATNALTRVKAMNRGGITNAWIDVEQLLELVMGDGLFQEDALTAIPQTRTLRTKMVTNRLYAATMFFDASRDVHASGTNAIGGNVTVVITNSVIGASGSWSLLSDGSARTVSFFSLPALPIWISTNATTSGTNLLTTASKRSLVNWSVRAGDGASPSTNIYLWAVNQP